MEKKKRLGPDDLFNAKDINQVLNVDQPVNQNFHNENSMFKPNDNHSNSSNSNQYKGNYSNRGNYNNSGRPGGYKSNYGGNNNYRGNNRGGKLIFNIRRWEL